MIADPQLIPRPAGCTVGNVGATCPLRQVESNAGVGDRDRAAVARGG